MARQRWLKGLAVALVAAGVVLVAPSSAYASASEHTACGSWQSPASGTAHAKIRNCTVDWFWDSLDHLNSTTVSFDLVDSSTDGVCAKAVVSASPGSHTYTECNGVWTNHKVSYGGIYTVTITLSYGSSSPVTKSFSP
jgi:hypothetical protein